MLTIRWQGRTVVAALALTVGIAADLIATYGTGEHSAFVQVRADEANETARTRAVAFRLNESAPQEESCPASC
jgi:hypothetical protein